MARTRKGQRKGRGGSALKLGNAAVNALSRIAQRATSKMPRKPEKPLHPNITNKNLENLHVVNTNTNEWHIRPGNRNWTVPKNLNYNPVKTTKAGPGVTVFQTR